MSKERHFSNRLWSIVMTVISVLYMYPIFMVLINSLKVESAISTSTAFELPTAETFAGLENYENAIGTQGFLMSLFYTTFITVTSVLAILIFCSMFAWYITRVHTKVTKALYMLCAFSMVVPFQMVMFTLSSMADTLKLIHCFAGLVRRLFIGDFDDLQFTVAAQPLGVLCDRVP